MGRAALVAAAAFLSLHRPAAAEDAGRISITPGGAKGALLFEVTAWPVVQQIAFTRNVTEGKPARPELVGVKGRVGDASRFIVMPLTPGEYRLVAVYQQGKWAACLARHTLFVAVEAGKIAYLGTLDTRPTLASIAANARANGHERAETFQWHLYRADVVAPRLVDRDAAGLARAEGFVRESMPRSSVSSVLADVRWGSYRVLGSRGRPSECD